MSAAPITKYKRQRIREVTGLSDIEVGIEARRMGITKRAWYADSARQYDEVIRELRRDAIENVNAKRRDRIARERSSPSPIFFPATSGTSIQTRFVDGDVEDAVFRWHRGPIVRLMRTAPRGTTLMVPYSFGESANSLQRLAAANFQGFFINSSSTRNIVELEAFRREYLSDNDASTFLADENFRKDLVDIISDVKFPCRVSLRLIRYYDRTVVDERRLVGFEIVSHSDEIDAFTIRNRQSIIPALEEQFHELDHMFLDSLRFVGNAGLVVTIVPVDPLRGNGYIPLPKELSNPKQGIVNPDNTDTNCFIWAILISLHKGPRNPGRVTQYRHLFDTVKIPRGVDVTQMGVACYEKVEKANDFSLNVFKWESEDVKDEEEEDEGEEEEEESSANSSRKHIAKIKRRIVCEYMTKGEKEKHVNLLLISNGKWMPGETEIWHYCSITNIDHLFCRVANNYNGAIMKCNTCMFTATSQEQMDRHKVHGCHGDLVLEVPDQDKAKIYFKHLKKHSMVPIVIYADFESILEAVEEVEMEMEMESKNLSNSRIHQKHRCISFCYMVINTLLPDHPPQMKTYVGSDAAVRFLTELMRDVKDIKEYYKSCDVPLKWKDATEENEFKEAETCYLCGKGDFSTRKKDGKLKCADHCHITGRYRGAAHAMCNSKLKNVHDVSIFFHNLKGYDAQHIMRALPIFARNNPQVSLVPIPQSSEKFISFSLFNEDSKDFDQKGKYKGRVGGAVFKDSASFLSDSLERLVASLKDTPSTFLRVNWLISQKLQNEEEKKRAFELLTLKGVFPYNFFDSEEKLYAKLEDIRREDFDDWLYNGQRVGDEEWQRFKDVVSLFKLSTLREYLVLYNQLDVCQLADVFESFRHLTFSQMKIDPAHEYTLPGQAWSMALKMCMPDVESCVQIPDDVTMMKFFEDGKRGGVSMISHRFAEFNNPYCPNFDESKPKTWGVDYDANSLYPTTMYEPLPVGDFEWEPVEKFKSKDFVLGLNSHGSRGYFFKLNIPAAPEKYHDLFSDYPLLPENRVVPIDDKHASPYNLYVADENGYDLEAAGKTTLLVPHLEEKKGYVVHYRVLQYAIEKGLFDDVEELDMISVLSFEQKPILKGFVEYCANNRKKAKTSFEKNYWKMIMNSLFGKTMESVRNRSEFKYFFNHQGEAYQRKVNSARFKNVRSIDDTHEMVCVEMRKYAVLYDKPMFMGVTILELSKLIMYRFHYDVMKKRYGEKCKLLMTDTDSLHYQIETEDLYKDLKELAKEYPTTFDTSDAPSWHPLYDPNPETNNKKRPGAMKDTSVESGIPLAHVGLKAKMYAELFVDIRSEGEKEQFPHFETEDKKAKGIKKFVVKNDIRFDDYVHCLRMGEIKRDVTQRLIQSKKHQLYSIEQKRIGLNPIDMKRWVCDDGITTLPFGHYAIDV